MKSLIELVKFYYDLAGAKIFTLAGLMFLDVGFQGIGLGLFLPILEGAKGDSKISQILKNVFAFVGLEYSLTYILVFVVCVFFMRALCVTGEVFMINKIVADLLVDLRCHMAEQLFNMDYQAFLEKPAGYRNNAMIVEFQKAVSSFKRFAKCLVTFLLAAMYLGISMFLNPVLILFLVFVGAVFFPVIIRINSLTKLYSVRTSTFSAGLQKIFIQALNNFKYLKATAEYPKVLRQVFNQSRKLGNLQIKQAVLSVISNQGTEPLIVLLLAGIVFYYVQLRGNSVVEILFLLYLVNSAMKRILGLQNDVRNILSMWGSVEVLRNFQQELIEHTEKSIGAGGEKNEFNKPVCVDNVSFRYKNGFQVLKNIDIIIPPFSTIAFVGGSGAGKTTMVNLLTGLLRPQEGAIKIGDIDYRDIDMNYLRKNIGYITQESVIFNDTVCNNITLWDTGNPEEIMQKVKQSARKAHIDTFIDDLESRYNTLLGEGGINISGGQRQRIAIARELYKDAKILIFDEATSSLDTQTEREIQKNIDELRGEKTVILIAHRLSTVKNADYIFVLKDGMIAESGSYDALYKRDGEFRRMIDQQTV